ncbi:hypothetical protein [Streptomyces sp. UNOB3_S3]|uniref:hypothetical protein n=1 Tax=Streptomyces sp. UNOB3_S3 TaxID=2871682 RepID=UPI001E4683BD|nr:hypothetical protein [Streptomyces sp. UNOB3_S3]MCC3777949.1 hypothetical protein [Streptomyces sp. UNOB3_S3]
MSRIPVVAVVDAYGTARHLGPLLRERGYALLHIREELLGAGELLQAVAAHRPVAVLAGAPSGAGLADLLAEGLGLPGNGTGLSEARAAGALPGEDPIEGTFHVNTVSLDGLHHICDIWRAPGPPGADVWDPAGDVTLLPRRGDEQDRLVAAALAALDALRLRTGPAHSVFRRTPDGPRLMGVRPGIAGRLPLLAREALGAGQLEWTVDAYVGPEWFRMRAGRDYGVY